MGIRKRLLTYAVVLAIGYNIGSCITKAEYNQHTQSAETTYITTDVENIQSLDNLTKLPQAERRIEDLIP
ncbi:MAG: hypothetical protein MAG795_00695 [Candidatus Woesearchaeota archaeon]|nr:hypothetical protein [Candidatus Woesearchaeota archaeon]